MMFTTPLMSEHSGTIENLDKKFRRAEERAEKYRDALEDMIILARALTSKHVFYNGQYFDVQETIEHARAALSDGGENG